MYEVKANSSGANGVILALFLKVSLIAYAIAYHRFGLRLPDLPGLPDLSVLTQLF